jgi:UDP-N-acetylmuramate dehydrogenase
MQRILRELQIEYQANAPLAQLTSYRVGGAAQALAHPASIEQLSALVVAIHAAAAPLRVLGSGANLLIADEGVPGVVVRLNAQAFRQVKIEGTTVSAGAGYDLPKLVLQTARAGLGGLDVLAGIPASVGGAVRMNAGGVYGQIGDVVQKVHLMDANGDTYWRDRDDLVFAYRRTNIVAPLILEIEFELTPGDPEELMRRVKKIFLHKRSTQPLAAHSAGCAFKNPTLESAPGTEALSAGALIDQAGLKGVRIGGAEVSQQHANFIVAHDGCSAADILAVLEHVEQTVLKTHGVELERELVVWP